MAEAGSVSVGATVALDLGPTGTLAPVRESLASGLVAPLRDRLERCVEEGDGDNDAVTKRARAVYREWKTQRIDEHSTTCSASPTATASATRSSPVPP